MTNREKLIELLQEKDGEVEATKIGGFISASPLMLECAYLCDVLPCNKCIAKWLNEEAKE